jgi:hypothetical protein
MEPSTINVASNKALSMARTKSSASAQSTATIGFGAKLWLAADHRRLNPAIPEEARATIRQFRIVQFERRLYP